MSETMTSTSHQGATPSQPEWDDDTLRSLSSSEPFTETVDQLQHAIHECAGAPSFDNAEQVCLACRTSFIVFTHEHLTSGQEKRQRLLTYMLSLLGDARRVVEVSRERISGTSASELLRVERITDYLKHIEDRIGLAELIRDEGMDAFRAELARRMTEISAGGKMAVTSVVGAR